MIFCIFDSSMDRYPSILLSFVIAVVPIFTVALGVSYETLKKRFEELAYLNKGLQIECRDERTGEVHLFHAEGGIHQFVKDLNSGEMAVHSIIDGEGVFR